MRSTIFQKSLMYMGIAVLTAVSQSCSYGQNTATMAQPDRQMQAVLDQLAILAPKPIETLSANEARHQPSASDAVIQLNQSKGKVAPEKLPAVGKVEMRAITGIDDNPIPLQVYTPNGDGPFPAIVYFHGGGWVIATLDTYDASCRAMASMAGAVVISVDYRYAPEHRFPAAPRDCYSALQYVMTRATEFGVNPQQIAVAGESAGGNLATVVCLMAKQQGGKMPIHQALIYPVTNASFDTPSYQENAQAKPLNAAMMKWFFDKYLSQPADAKNILVSPMLASATDLRGLPSATLVTAQIDPLRSDGVAYAQKLQDAGIDVKSKTYNGVTHEFFGMGLAVDQAMSAEKFVTGRLKDSFSAAR